MVFFGIHVVKETLDCAVVVQGRERPIGQKAFPNTPDGIERAVAWVANTSRIEVVEVHAVLEPTAAYHEPVARLLAAKGLDPARQSLIELQALLARLDDVEGDLRQE